jgi:membrane peptidoglycan carboxypeptidase
MGQKRTRVRKRSRGTRILSNVLALVACGAVGGVMVAAATFPAVGFAGMSAKSASDSFEHLPSQLQTPQLPQTSYLYASNGALITTFFDQNRVPTPLTSVPMVMRHAMIAAEDARFYQHSGVDPQGVVRAFVANQGAGEVTQGASTLTQQYVRNVLMATAKTKEERRQATERTAARKLREIRYAIALEERLEKDQILERYLDIAFFGNNGYGIGAASQVYFSHGPQKLSLAESAMLAGMVKSPTAYNPIGRNPAPALERRNYILQRMVELDFITQAEADAAKKAPLGLRPSRSAGSCVNGNPAYGFYCGYFVDWWRSNPAFGSTPAKRMDNLRRGGYRITAALDGRMQAAAQKAADDQVSRESRFATGIVLIEPGTGRVRAMSITRTYSLADNPDGKDYPNTVNPLLTGSTISPGYQAGSTFKMFTMVAALRMGMPLSTSFYAPQQYRTIYYSTGPASCGDRYCPRNASPGMTGRHTMWSGFGESVNTYFIQLEQKATVRNAVKAAEDLGIVFRSYKDQENRAAVQKRPNGEWGSFTLGTALVPPMDMANAYATVAARGKKCEPTPVQLIFDRTGKSVPAASTKCKQVIPQDVADAAADAAHCPVGDPAAGRCTAGNGATARSVGREIDRVVSGKTGTTDSNRAAWFVGFTPSLAGAAFYVDPDAPNTSSVPNSRVPIEVFKKAMVGSLPFTADIKFVPPTRARAYGNDSSNQGDTQNSDSQNPRRYWNNSPRRPRNSGQATLPSPGPVTEPTQPVRPRKVTPKPTGPPPVAPGARPHIALGRASGAAGHAA